MFGSFWVPISHFRQYCIATKQKSFNYKDSVFHNCFVINVNVDIHLLLLCSDHVGCQFLTFVNIVLLQNRNFSIIKILHFITALLLMFMFCLSLFFATVYGVCHLRMTTRITPKFFKI